MAEVGGTSAAADAVEALSRVSTEELETDAEDRVWNRGAMEGDKGATQLEGDGWSSWIQGVGGNPNSLLFECVGDVFTRCGID